MRKKEKQTGHALHLSYRDKPLLIRLIRAGVILTIWGAVALFFLILWAIYDLPDIKNLEAGMRRPSIVFVSRHNEPIAHYGDVVGEVVTAKTVPPYLLHAIIATEDRRFYNHHGIDIIGLIRAMGANLRAGHIVQGGSTLTQQIAKNIFLSNQRSFTRKIKEACFAIWLEHHFTKNQLLSIYLNRLYLGAGVFGFDAAAQEYFGKSVRHVTMAEACVLAGLLKAPSRYGASSNQDLLKERAMVVAANMKDAGYIKEKTYKTLIQSIKSLHFKHAAKKKEFRYFTDWIMSQLPDLVDVNEDIVVMTTMDLEIQRRAAAALQSSYNQIKNSHAINGAAFVAIAHDGAVLAIVGGHDYAQSAFNRSTQANRQIGSLAKLFVYLSALEKGWDPSQLINDGPVTFKEWRPKNFGWEEQGDISLMLAFSKSVNTAAVRLAHQVGVRPIIDLAKRMGMDADWPHDLTIALGSGESTPLEITNAFNVIANGGYLAKPYGILEIRNTDGKLLYGEPSKSLNNRVLEPGVVDKIKDMLSEVIKTGTGRQAFVEGLSLGGKTGTTQHYRDAWFIGYTPTLTATVWLGTDKVEKSLRPLVGATFPARIWHDIIKSIPTIVKPPVEVNLVETLTPSPSATAAPSDIPVIVISPSDQLPQTNNVTFAPGSNDQQGASPVVPAPVQAPPSP